MYMQVYHRGSRNRGGAERQKVPTWGSKSIFVSESTREEWITIGTNCAGHGPGRSNEKRGVKGSRYSQWSGLE